ncbi:NmrA family NAD(P)-binding protein [Dyadobacter crusticola]|uniref:NmrA family NAD(P)-binding protein n=1 Tax=Dyadobacter crusticola TaxID=292407 RepID=UPI0004E12DF5|nr:NmrA family NAD(P)-binding protein [Dyadobacter crusticola]
MHIILGGTGHVGSAVVNALVSKGEPVTIVTRNKQNAAAWEGKGAQVAVADVFDSARLKTVFLNGKTVLLLNPPAMPHTDTVEEERRSLRSIFNAMDGSGLQRIVALSTYGAQPGDRIGDLGTLYEMELALRQQTIPYAVVRAAYYMSNWDMYLDFADQSGELQSLYPPDFKIPMVAPEDIGELAADLLTGFDKNGEMHYIEGPEHYSTRDVAAAFSQKLKKAIVPVAIPQQNWRTFLTSAGFSEVAAESLANMSEITLKKDYEITLEPHKGRITLQDYIKRLAPAPATS